MANPFEKNYNSLQFGESPPSQVSRKKRRNPVGSEIITDGMEALLSKCTVAVLFDDGLGLMPRCVPHGKGVSYALRELSTALDALYNKQHT